MDRWMVYVSNDEWTGVSCGICHSENEAKAFAKTLDELCPLADARIRKLKEWEWRESEDTHCEETPNA